MLVAQGGDPKTIVQVWMQFQLTRRDKDWAILVTSVALSPPDYGSWEARQGFVVAQAGKRDRCDGQCRSALGKRRGHADPEQNVGAVPLLWGGTGLAGMGYWGAA